MRPFVRNVIDELARRHPPGSRIDLNDIAEVLGAAGGGAISYEEVDAVVAALEERGHPVGEPLEAHDLDVVRGVVAAATTLRAELGRVPTVSELAQATGQPEHAVRRALEAAVAARR